MPTRVESPGSQSLPLLPPCSDTAWIHSGYTLIEQVGHDEQTNSLLVPFVLIYL